MTVTRDIKIVQGQRWVYLFEATGLVSDGNGLRLHIRDHLGATLIRAALTHDGATNARVSFAAGGVLANLGATISTAWDLQNYKQRRWVYSLERYSLSDADDVDVLYAGDCLVDATATDESSINTVAPFPSYDLVAVRFDLVQSLTTEQKARARANIGVGEGGGGDVAWGAITGTLASQTDLVTALALKATVASPTFTGVPAAPTAAGGTSTTQVATTAFVGGELTTHANASDPHPGYLQNLASHGTDAVIVVVSTNGEVLSRSSYTAATLIAAGAAAAPVQSVAGRTGAVVIAVADVTGAESTANKGQPSGYASLDSGGKLPQAQLPAIAISEFLGDVASQAAMLALSGQKGDWCTRSDTGATWIITGTDPTLLGSWTSVSYPASPVTSVAGRTGAVTISSTDITDSTGAGRAVMTAADAAAIRTAAGVVIGTDVQGYSAALAGTTASFTTAQETKLSGIEALADVTDAGNVGAAVHGATEKTAPTGADKFPINDSAASWVLKWISWTSITTALAALFAPVGRTISAAGLATGGGDLSANRTITVPGAAASDVSTGTSTSVAMTPESYKKSIPFEGNRTADWTITQADENTENQFNSASPLVCTIDTNANQAIATKTCFMWSRVNSGTATIDAVAGVTINGVDGASVTLAEYGVAFGRKIGTNAYLITGDLE